jgi:LysM repeat protein
VTEAPTTAIATSLSIITEAVVITPAPTEAVVTTPPPTAAPTSAAPKKKAAPKKPATTQAPQPTAAQAAEKTPCTLTYTVVKNDAWSTIASRAKVSMKDLLAANDAMTSTLLLPGKTVCLPAGATVPAAPATTAAPAAKPATTPPATTQPKPPTTPAPTTPPNTQPAPPPNTTSRAQAAQIIRDVWPDDLEDIAIQIATRESNLIPIAHNSCCYGLFQIYYSAHKSWLASIGVTSAAQLYDAQVNANAAYALYRMSGWSPWGGAPTTTTIAAG